MKTKASYFNKRKNPPVTVNLTRTNMHPSGGETKGAEQGVE